MEKTNEPVAWISVLGVDLIGQKFTDVRVSLTKTDVASIPLYTHPVSQYKAITNTKIEPTVVSYTHPVKELDRELLDKTIIDQQNEIKDLRKNLDVALMIINKPELTDEEIEDECRKAWGLHDQDQLNLEEVFKFARAILRKAREK